MNPNDASGLTRISLIAPDGTEHDITGVVDMTFAPTQPTGDDTASRTITTAANYTVSFTMAPGSRDRLLALFGLGQHLSQMHAAYRRKTARRNRRRR